MSGTPEEFTLYLRQIRAGDRSAVDRLLPHVYQDLRGLAGAVFQGQGADHTLQPTALVHEAWMRLAKQGDPSWSDRKHFLRVAAVAMRQLLTDYARARSAEKRGGDVRQVVLSEEVAVTLNGQGIQLIALEQALTKLERLHERQARIVELRFLAGFSIAETAEALDVSVQTVSLDWKMARIFLQRELGDD